MKSKSQSKTETRIEHPAEESATSDPAFLAHELTRLNMELTLLAAKRNEFHSVIEELTTVYNDAIAVGNRGFLALDCKDRLIETKLNNVKLLLRNLL